MNNTLSLKMLLRFILLCLAVELLGGWLTGLSVTTWYPQLHKPSWTPPNALFGPVWTALYILMAVSLWLVWKEPTDRSKATAYWLFTTQMALNLLWSGLFFGLQRPDLALLDIGALWLAIIATILAFYNIRPMAAYLLIPYLVWVSYASTLNGAIWLLNR